MRGVTWRDPEDGSGFQEGCDAHPQNSNGRQCGSSSFLRLASNGTISLPRQPSATTSSPLLPTPLPRARSIVAAPTPTSLLPPPKAMHSFLTGLPSSISRLLLLRRRTRQAEGDADAIDGRRSCACPLCAQDASPLRRREAEPFISDLRQCDRRADHK